MQNRICEHCGDPIRGQSVNQYPGPGPMHPSCWEDSKEAEEGPDLSLSLGIEDISNDDQQRWTTTLPQRPGYYWRSREGEEVDGLYEIGYDSSDETDQLHIIYGSTVSIKISYFEGEWWKGPVSKPNPPK